eukprot:4031129-Heterocapsa_arctica.AAC.1
MTPWLKASIGWTLAFLEVAPPREVPLSRPAPRLFVLYTDGSAKHKTSKERVSFEDMNNLSDFHDFLVGVVLITPDGEYLYTNCRVPDAVVR